MSISKKQYVPMNITVLGELNSQTLGSSNYLANDGDSTMGMAVDQGNDQDVLGSMGMGGTTMG